MGVGVCFATGGTDLLNVGGGESVFTVSVGGEQRNLYPIAQISAGEAALSICIASPRPNELQGLFFLVDGVYELV